MGNLNCSYLSSIILPLFLSRYIFKKHKNPLRTCFNNSQNKKYALRLQQEDQSVWKKEEYDVDLRLIEGNVNFKIHHCLRRAQRSRWMCDALSSQVFFSGFLKMITKIQWFLFHMVFSQQLTEHYFSISNSLKFNTPPYVITDNTIVRFMPITAPLQRTTADLLQRQFPVTTTLLPQCTTFVD